MTEILSIDAAAPQADRVARAATCLQRGGLVAFPTETVYGLGVDARNREAVRRLFAAKGRPATDPLIVHVTAIADIAPLVASLPDTVDTLARAFWPGPLTLVMPRSPIVPDEVTAGLDTVAVRNPAHPIARAIIAASGLPVAAPSANLFSRPSPTTAQHVLADLDGRVDLVIDGGPTGVGVESTVLDLSGAIPSVLRPGAVTLEMLRTVLPRVEMAARQAATDAPQPSPGLLTRHYAPRTPLTLYRGQGAWPRLVADARALIASGRQVAVLAASHRTSSIEQELSGARPIHIGSIDEPETIARRLYAALREADGCGADVLLMEDIEGEMGLPVAIRDRLTRAAERIVGT